MNLLSCFFFNFFFMRDVKAERRLGKLERRGEQADRSKKRLHDFIVHRFSQKSNAPWKSLNHHTKEPNSFNHFLKLVLRWKSSNASRHLTGHALVIFQLSPLLKYFQVDIDNTVNSFSVKKKINWLFSI